MRMNSVSLISDYIGHSLHVEQVALAVAHLDGAGVGALRLDRVDLDGAALGIRPRQRPLRAAQDLDAVQVQQSEVRTREAGVVDVVDIDADARRKGRVEVGLPDAADGRGHAGTERAAGFHQRHIGRLLAQIMQRGLAALFHRLAR